MAEESEKPSSSVTQRSPADTAKQFQVPAFSGFPAFTSGDVQMLPIMYPALAPALAPLQNQEQMNSGAGIYAIPVVPFMGHVSGLPSNALIPLTYTVPTTSPEAGPTSEGRGQSGQQQHQQQPAPQRQVVIRRFQIAFQLDLLLILKLAAVIFLFNQDGSRQRLLVLVFFASLVYLYQTGALTPLIRWLSQSMQRAAQPPRPPRPAARADNVPAAARPENENAGVAEGQAGAENENQPAAGDGNQAAMNENVAEPGAGNGGNHWWGIVKEVQMIVIGFITSLLPGFHNID